MPDTASMQAADSVAADSFFHADRDLLLPSPRRPLEDLAGGRLESAILGLRRRVDELQHTARHKARDAVRSADASFHDHPYGAIGVAALAGLLVGVLAARRRGAIHG